MRPEEASSPVFATREQARAAVFWWIEVFYNRRRRHSFCGQLAPFEYERRWAAALPRRSPKVSTEPGQAQYG
jgi:putative transposase